MANNRIQYSVRTLGFAAFGVAVAAAGLQQYPGGSICILSVIPFLVVSYFLFFKVTSVRTKGVLYPAILLALIPIYIASVGPFYIYAYENGWQDFYAPLEFFGEDTIFQRPLNAYAEMWGIS